MKDPMEYNGYFGTVHYSDNDLRLDPDLYERFVSNAMSEGKTLNAFVKELLQRAVSG